MISKTVRVLRPLIADRVFFNDLLKSGRRSIKVWGWKLQDYYTAESVLRSAGLLAEIKFTLKYSSRRGEHYTQPRLHVTE